MYKWVIVGTAFLVLGISWATAQSGFGAFVTPLTGGMGWSRTEVSAAFSINIMTTFAVGVFWGWLADRWSVRGVIAVTGLLMGLGLFLASMANALWQIYLFYGLIAGVGLGGTAGPLTAIVFRWFPRRPGMAIGIVYAGVGGASAVLPVIAERLIAYDGWRFAFQGLSFLIWGVFVVGIVLLREHRPHLSSSPVSSEGPNPDLDAADAEETRSAATDRDPVAGDVSLNLLTALRARSFWIIFGMVVAGNLVLDMILVHLVARAIDGGVTPSIAVTLLTVTGLVNMVSTMVGGVLGDRFGARRVYLAALLLLTAALVWLTVSTALWMLYVFAVAFGVGNGGWFPQIPVLAGRIFGNRHIGTIFAALLLGAGVGAVVGPIVAGYVFDVTGSYKIAFIVAAGTAFGAVVLTAMLKDRPHPARSRVPS